VGVIIDGQMFSGTLLMNATVLLPIFLIFLIVCTIKKIKARHIFKLILLILLSAYLYLLISVTLFPVNIFPRGDAVYQNGFGQQAWVTNFDLTQLLSYLPKQILGNLIMLAPLTFLSAAINPRFANFRMSLKLGFAVSLTIELLQLVMSYFYLGNRICDINDLLLNTLGAVLGYFAFVVCKHVLLKIKVIEK
jgi:glycopeptide antibiotics resistance protein